MQIQTVTDTDAETDAEAETDAVDTTTGKYFTQCLPRKPPWHSPRHETAAGNRRHILPAAGQGVNAARQP